jgi:predicted RNA-binding protein associated with RNAse of E/G family
MPNAPVSDLPGITVRKLDLEGREVFAYAGRVLRRTATAVVVEAIFDRRDRMELGYTVFERGDRFVEYFYSDRWYNIFEVHAVGDDRLRGWYCNITRPAVIAGEAVSAVDLALDVFVYPDGRVLVLDEDEFAALPIAEPEREAARQALAELKGMVEAGEEPFEKEKKERGKEGKGR